MSWKPGRNDPCPCGSGQKYKRCCLPREEAERAEALKQRRLWDDEVEDFEDDDLPDVDPEDAGIHEDDDSSPAPMADFDLDAVLKAHRRQPGICQLCDAALTSSGAARHVTTCAPAHDPAKGPLQTLVHLRVTSPGRPGYWLELEMRDDATLDALDRFLRDLWLECCGHLSQFLIGPVEFVSHGYDFGFESGLGRRRTKRSMGTRLAQALALTEKRFSYDYDFGSTTQLQIDIKGSRSGRIGRRAVRLLARNTPPEWPCGVCAEPAAFIDLEAGGYPFLCRAHAQNDENGALLPLVNSPRTGVCAYDAET